LLRRKYSKEVILNSIYDLIRSNYSIKIIKLIFEKISKLIHKVFLPIKSGNSLRNTISFGERIDELKNSFDLSFPKVFLITIIKNIYLILFQM